MSIYLGSNKFKQDMHVAHAYMQHKYYLPTNNNVNKQL